MDDTEAEATAEEPQDSVGGAAERRRLEDKGAQEEPLTLKRVNK